MGDPVDAALIAAADDDAPDAAGALAVAGDEQRELAQRASIASPKRTLVLGLGLDPDARGAARLQDHRVAGRQLAVDADPLERALDAVTPSSRSHSSASTRASVCTNTSSVAKLGEIMPAPLPWTVSGRCRRQRDLERARLANASVVRIASAKSPSPSARSSRAPARVPRVDPRRWAAAPRSRRSRRPRPSARRRRRRSRRRPASWRRRRVRGRRWRRSRCRS